MFEASEQLDQLRPLRVEAILLLRYGEVDGAARPQDGPWMQHGTCEIIDGAFERAVRNFQWG